MRRPDGRTIRRTCLRTWLAAGVLATGYGCLVSGCSPMTPVVEPIAPAATIAGLDAAVGAAPDDAARSWQQLFETTDNPTLKEMAKWHRISIGASQ